MKFLRIQRLCLKSIGYSFKQNENLLHRLYSLLSLISVLAIVIPELHFVIENISDIPLATDALCTLLTTFLSFLKILTMYSKKDIFYNVINQLDDMWLKSKFIYYSRDFISFSFSNQLD